VVILEEPNGLCFVGFGGQIRKFLSVSVAVEGGHCALLGVVACNTGQMNSVVLAGVEKAIKRQLLLARAVWYLNAAPAIVTKVDVLPTASRRLMGGTAEKVA